jgi:enterobacteria phage integrase
MSPRARKEINRGLPANLRLRDGVYSYRVPKAHRIPGAPIEPGLGTNRQYAIEQAIRANALLAAKRLSLVERISGAAQSWGEWCNQFEKLLGERKARPNTIRTRKSQMVRLRASFDANLPASKITTRQCAEVISGLKKSGKHRTAQAFRSFLIDCFDRMIAQGWRTDNPARVLDAVTVDVQRSRLTLEAFEKLYEATSIVWLRNAMALAIVSGQPRECVAAAKFADFRDGCWWNERGKTGARIALPLELRLACFGMSIADVVRQCRGTGIVSKSLVHQTERAKGATLGKAMHVDMITRVFSAELAKLGLSWGDKEPPTFHEIRSLSERLYKAQGNVNTQELLGHKDPRTTALYHDGRGEWVRVGITG